jgi:hypothetical protein
MLAHYPTKPGGESGANSNIKGVAQELIPAGLKKKVLQENVLAGGMGWNAATATVA